MKIITIKKNSLAEIIGLKVGDDLKTINSNPIRDSIDLRFWSDEDTTTLSVVRDGKFLDFHVEGGLADFGVEFQAMKYRCCGNKCIFCFVDQNPKGLRKTLYFKDEDFRLSFLYGNYVTLSNTSQTDLERIVHQRLSPLYISVHATDPAVRKRMFGLRRDDHLMRKLLFLAQHKIEMHVQIVLCPGINDGDILNQTLSTLLGLFPRIKTVAIVPVGLTKHRQGLPKIRQVDEAYANRMIDQIEKKSRKIFRDITSYFIYLADEFYILARRPIPLAEQYEGFEQVENGVGMTRYFLDEFNQIATRLPTRLSSPFQLTLVTGKLAESFILKAIANRLNSIINLRVNVIAVKNEFYGKGVTVSGLLVGADIYRALRNEQLGDEVWLPRNCVNYDGALLDDWTPQKLQTSLNAQIRVVTEGLPNAIENLTRRL